MNQGERIDNYTILKKIAVGGMSEIYLVSQGGIEGFDRAVVLKSVRSDLETDREVLDMFLDEARIAACLKHSNIVHLYDVGEHHGVPFLTMEHIFGRDMIQICARARQLNKELPVQFVLKVMCDALAGLHYAHEVATFEDRPLHTVHRDVSPQNILVSFDGVTKLVDFGIAKAETRLSKTQAGVLKGKYAYMSPEQVRGRDLDHRSDQFSLAVVIYEALTNTTLFQRENDYSTMEAVDACDIPPIRELRKGVPRRAARLLRRALRPQVNRRYQSCKEMERLVHRLLKGSNVEQTDYQARIMQELFAPELQAREQAIQSLPAEKRELVLSTGFELLPLKQSARKDLLKAPTAIGRYEELIAERQAVRTARSRRALQQGGATDDVTTQRGQPMGKAHKPPAGRPAPRQAARKSAGKPARKSAMPDADKDWLSDWRFLLAVFAGVVVLSMLIISLLSSEDAAPSPAELAGEPQALKPGQYVAGRDGFLSVLVRASVSVTLDGRQLGVGSLRRKPLAAGLHEVVLRDLETGTRIAIPVRVELGQEALIAPPSFQ